MAKITCYDKDWSKPAREFTIIHANVDILSMHILDHKMGDRYIIKCESITEWINMAQWSDAAWMIWINENKPQ